MVRNILCTLRLKLTRSSYLRGSMKKMFLKILQNSQENTCVRVFFLIKLPQACNFINKETLAQVFSCKFCDISKNTFFTKHLWEIAPGLQIHWNWNIQFLSLKNQFYKRITSTGIISYFKFAYCCIWDEVFKSELSNFFKGCLPQNWFWLQTIRFFIMVIIFEGYK